MKELLDVAIQALRNEKTVPNDRRVYEAILKRNIIYLSERELREVKYLMKMRKPA